MFDKNISEKGDLIYSDYLSPKYDKLRMANDIMLKGSGITAILSFFILLFFLIEIFAWIFLLSFFGFIFILFSSRSYKRRDFKIYTNGVEGYCSIYKPFLNSPRWIRKGRKFIPYDDIEKIYHRTDIGKPIAKANNFPIGALIVELKIKNSNLVCIIPWRALSEVLSILEKKFGKKWREIYIEP